MAKNATGGVSFWLPDILYRYAKKSELSGIAIWERTAVMPILTLTTCAAVLVGSERRDERRQSLAVSMLLGIWVLAPTMITIRSTLVGAGKEDGTQLAEFLQPTLLTLFPRHGLEDGLPLFLATQGNDAAIDRQGRYSPQLSPDSNTRKGNGHRLCEKARLVARAHCWVKKTSGRSIRNTRLFQTRMISGSSGIFARTVTFTGAPSDESSIAAFVSSGFMSSLLGEVFRRVNVDSQDGFFAAVRIGGEQTILTHIRIMGTNWLEIFGT